MHTLHSVHLHTQSLYTSIHMYTACKIVVHLATKLYPLSHHISHTPHIYLFNHKNLPATSVLHFSMFLSSLSPFARFRVESTFILFSCPFRILILLLPSLLLPHWSVNLMSFVLSFFFLIFCRQLATFTISVKLDSRLQASCQSTALRLSSTDQLY